MLVTTGKHPEPPSAVNNDWVFVGAVARLYTTPTDRVSRWVEPGDVHSWPDGPPDSAWDRAATPTPAAVAAPSDPKE